MPIVEISSREVLANRSAEESGRVWRVWPTRGESNRVEPIAKPDFEVPFRLVPSENVFTIGSCFARNVEKKLQDRGFQIPALEIFKRQDFAGIDPNALNNYAVPSIYQEFAWALDPDFPFDPKANFHEVLPGKFIDAHLLVGIRPAPLEVVAARREAVRLATTRVKDCRVVVMTLGLAEVWYDKKHDIYINTHPRLKLMEAEPDRYVLRVLSFDETIYYLRKIVDTLEKFCRPDLQIIVTVSPVPMGITHRPIDIMVANTYSKSVLRAAAEHIVAERANVHYYPSYESIILSDRQRAYKYDMIHVEQEMVDLNVGRMVSAFAGRNEAADELDVTALLEQIAKEGENNPRLRWNLLRDNAQRISDSMEFAVAYIGTAISRHAWGLAQDALQKAPNEWAPAQKELLEARILIGEGEFAAAKELLQSLSFSESRKLTPEGRTCYLLLVEANIGLMDMAAAEDAARVFARNVGRRGGNRRVYEMLGRAYKEANGLKKAHHYLSLAIEFNQGDRLILDCAEVLLALKRKTEAVALLEKAACKKPVDCRRKQHLLSFAIGSA